MKLKIFLQIVEAIQYLHAEEVCHRDINPNNIMVWFDTDNNPRVTLIDFSTAIKFEHLSFLRYDTPGTLKY